MVVVDAVDVESCVGHLEELDHLQKLKLLHDLDLLIVIHPFANYRLDTVKGSVLQLLGRFRRLQYGHAQCRNRLLEVVQIIPINKLSHYV